MFVKRLIFFTIIFVAMVIINNLGHSIFSLWQKKALIVKAQEELEHEKQQNLELKTKLEEVKMPQYVEKEARDKLFLAKPGEGIVIIPSDAPKKGKKTHSSTTDRRENWEKWRDLFF